MRIALVNTNRYREPPVIPVGLEYLVEPLRLSGHEVRLCDLTFSDDPIKALVACLEDARPDVIGLTVRNVDAVLFGDNTFFLDEITGLVEVARKNSGVPIIAGGTSTLCSAEGLRKYLGADCIVDGPAEKALPGLLDSLSMGADLPASIDGWKAGIIPEVIHPRGELVDYRQYLEKGNPAGLEFRKGCDWGCGFCIERKRPILRREVSAVVAEARRLARAGANMFFFCDSEVNIDTGETCALLEALAEAETGLKWSGYFRPVPFDARMAGLAASSGCRDLTLSINSWDLSTRNSPYDASDVRLFLGLCWGEGIKVAVDLLVGYPGETPASIESAIALLASLSPASVAVNEFIRLYENTPVQELARRTDKGKIYGSVEGNPSLLRPVFFSCVERPWLEERLSNEPGFVLADSERTVNYLRVSG